MGGMPGGGGDIGLGDVGAGIPDMDDDLGLDDELGGEDGLEGTESPISGAENQDNEEEI